MEATVTPAVSASAPGRTTGQFGVVVFLASDIMLFAAFFAAYFLLRSTADQWPAEGVELDTVRDGFFTLVLVSSSFTMIAADRAHDRGDRRRMRHWLTATILLGGAFFVNQITEYATIDFRWDESTYGSVFWGLTGLHAMHVLGGLTALVLLYIRATRTRSLDEITPWANGISLFWHLVDVIWVCVFVTIFVIR
ncbi:cytochrome c oxidase subunit 3 [Ilumatobacter sp.]|uniref:cytochrome c oxidase subunit 3 n=1 Tax=Ilumatobacter sp. TaxID=1967498 RepID=UPI003C338857